MTITMEKPALGSAAAKFLAREHKLFIDGKWIAAQSGKTIAVEDPATEETIAHVPAGERADIAPIEIELRPRWIWWSVYVRILAWPLRNCLRWFSPAVATTPAAALRASSSS